VVALAYSGADVVGRWANEVHLVDRDVTVAQDLDRQERWAHHLPGATMLLPADVLRAVRFRRVPRHVDTHLLRSIHAAGGAPTPPTGSGSCAAATATTTPTTRDARPATPPRRPGLDRTVLDV
jgi:hypothetical protein